MQTFVSPEPVATLPFHQPEEERGAPVGGGVGEVMAPLGNAEGEEREGDSGDDIRH